MRNKLSINGGIREAFNEARHQYEIYGKENVFDLSIGNPGAPVPEKVIETLATLSKDKSLPHSYMCEAGYEDTRQAIASNLNKTYGANYEVNNIIMTNGVAGGMNCTLCALLDPGDEVIIFRPYYGAYIGFTENWGGKIVEVSSNEENFLPDLKELEEKISRKTKVVIINSPHNPTGAIYPQEIAEQMSAILNQKQLEYGHEIYLLSDEPYRDLVYDDTILPWWPKEYENTIVAYSFSKSLSLAGERIGYVLVPPQVAESELVIRAIRLAMGRVGFVNAPAYFQRVIGECVNEKVDLQYYEQNRKLLYGSLKRLGFQAIEPKGAFYVFVKSPFEKEEDFVEAARQRHLIVVGGNSFGMSGYVRMSFCCEHEVLERAVPALEKLAEDCGLAKNS